MSLYHIDPPLLNITIFNVLLLHNTSNVSSSLGSDDIPFSSVAKHWTLFPLSCFWTLLMLSVLSPCPVIVKRGSVMVTRTIHGPWICYWESCCWYWCRSRWTGQVMNSVGDSQAVGIYDWFQWWTCMQNRYVIHIVKSQNEYTFCSLYWYIFLICIFR
jgi:hypothetical protein